MLLKLRGGKEGTHAIVTGNDETSKIRQGLAPKVEGNKEKIESSKTTNDIGLRYASLFLEIDQEWILGQLFVKLGDVMLGFILIRHPERLKDWRSRGCEKRVSRR